MASIAASNGQRLFAGEPLWKMPYGKVAAMELRMFRVFTAADLDVTDTVIKPSASDEEAGELFLCYKSIAKAGLLGRMTFADNRWRACRLSSVLWLRPGHDSPVFQRCREKGVSLPPPSLCWSLMLADRSIDCVCSSTQQAAAWVHELRGCVDAAKAWHSAQRNGHVHVRPSAPPCSASSSSSVDPPPPAAAWDDVDRQAYWQVSLLASARAGRAEDVALALREGADPSTADSETGDNALCCAARDGWPRVVRACLEAGMALDPAGEASENALEVAVRAGRLACVCEILSVAATVAEDAGYVLGHTDRYGNTPLHTAAAAGHASIVSRLLECSASAVGSALALRNGAGRTPLHCACAGATGVGGGGTPAPLRILPGAEPACAVDADCTVQALLSCGAEGMFSWGDADGSSPLHLASRAGAVHVVTTLLATLANPRLVNPRTGRTPVCEAREGGHAPTLAVLLQYSAGERRVGEEVEVWGAAHRLYLDSTRARTASGGSLEGEEWGQAWGQEVVGEEVAAAVVAQGADLLPEPCVPTSIPALLYLHPWMQGIDPTSNWPYWYNCESGESSWEAPAGLVQLLSRVMGGGVAGVPPQGGAGGAETDPPPSSSSSSSSSLPASASAEPVPVPVSLLSPRPSGTGGGGGAVSMRSPISARPAAPPHPLSPSHLLDSSLGRSTGGVGKGGAGAPLSASLGATGMLAQGGATEEARQSASSASASAGSDSGSEGKPASLPCVPRAAAKYGRMLRMGVPLGPVLHKARLEGLPGCDPSVLAELERLVGELGRGGGGLQGLRIEEEEEGGREDKGSSSSSLPTPTPPPPPPPPPSDPRFDKYARMKKMGVPLGAIKGKLEGDGVGPSEVRAFLLSLGSAGEVDRLLGGEVHTGTAPPAADITGAQAAARRRLNISGRAAHTIGSGPPPAQSRTHAPTLKLHWDPLKLDEAAYAKSMWVQGSGTDAGSGSSCALNSEDVDLLTSLFAAKASGGSKGVGGVPAAPTGTSGGSGGRVDPTPTPSPPTAPLNSVTLLDPKRANNLNIGLAQFRRLTSGAAAGGVYGTGWEALVTALYSLDETCLPRPALEALTGLMPTADECAALRRYTGTAGALMDADRFYRLLACAVPRFERKVAGAALRLSAPSALADLSAKASLLSTACGQVRSSANLRTLLGCVLSIGNVLNEGVEGLQASAIRLESLLKLGATRSAVEAGTTLMDALVLLAERRGGGGLLRWHEDLPAVVGQAGEGTPSPSPYDASRLELPELRSELGRLRSGLASAGKEADSEDADVAGGGGSHPCTPALRTSFASAMRAFTVHAAPALARAEADVAGAEAEARQLAEYFGEDPRQTPPAAVFAVLKRFAADFGAAVRGRAAKSSARAAAARRAVKEKQ